MSTATRDAASGGGGEEESLVLRVCRRFARWKCATGDSLAFDANVDVRDRMPDNDLGLLASGEELRLSGFL